MSVTISDVAKKAGVAIGTVSRAFNGYDDILPATREKIFAAAETLGYIPNANARSLSSKRPPNICFLGSGLMEGDDLDTNFPRLLRGILQYSNQHALDLALYATDSEEQRRMSFTEFCRVHSASGVILSGIKTNDPYLEGLLDSGIPTVTVDVPVLGDGKGWVSVDNAEAAADAVRTLLKLGVRHLVIMAGKEEAAVNQERMLGVRRAFEEAHLPLSEEQICYGQFRSDLAEIELTRYLAEHAEAPDAVFAFSDIMAVGVLRALISRGLSIPEDVNVMGFDDMPFSEITSPPLSTVRQDMYQFGHEAASMLHRMIQGELSGGHVILPHQIILRGTTRNEAL